MEHIGKFCPATGDTFFTDWMPRLADNAVFTYEQIAQLGTNDIVVKVYHKNNEDSGQGSEKATLSTLVGASGSRYKEGIVTELKELVRYGVSVGSGDGEVGVLYRILPPNWYDTTEA